jgi:uncharacterized cupredoxin-like copper-binding protein
VKTKFILALLLPLSIPVTALADAGHQHGEDRAYGQPGDAKKPARIVLITMNEVDQTMKFIPSEVKIRKGEQVKFVIRNNGALDHEIVIATVEENLKHAEEMAKNPDMEHDDPNAKRLAPKKVGEMVWKFTKAGEFDFSCLIPGHREAGMFGKIIVQ